MASILNVHDALQTACYNPATIQRVVYDYLENATGSQIEILDPSNPFVFLLEASSVTTAAAMVEIEALIRKQYPSMAMTEDELYLHMSDRDYIDRFSAPARTTFTVLLNKKEVIKRAIPTYEANMSKLVIPRNTEFSVSNLCFTMEYPIEIRVLSHGGIQVVWDVTKDSPLQQLESNIVDWQIIKAENEEYIQIKIPVNQFKIDSYYMHLSKGAPAVKTFPFNDKYYCCRIWRYTKTGEWEEMLTTHTDQVFNPDRPTALLKLYETSLNVAIPHVYITSGLLAEELRIDIYTTKGEMNLYLDGFKTESFAANWRDLESKELDRYSAPLNVFNSIAVFSDAIAQGGTNGITFDVLKERVINNALGNRQLPITHLQMVTQIQNYGYDGIKSVDNITNRLYQVTRALPPPSTGTTLTSAATCFHPIQISFRQLETFRYVKNNGKRMTITPDATFEIVNNILSIIPDSVTDRFPKYNIDQFIALVNKRGLLMTPFHYVLDTTGEYFKATPYFLDIPVIKNREYIEENISLGLGISTQITRIQKNKEGYKLRILTKSNDTLKEIPVEKIYVQLSFVPAGQNKDVFLNGRYIGLYNGEYAFEFDLYSNLDVDDEDNLYLYGFQMYGDENKEYACSLTTRFNLVYYISDFIPEYENVRDLNYNGGYFKLPETVIGMSHEVCTIEFGQKLEGLWGHARTVAGSQSYKKYQSNVYAFYEENEYLRDPLTGAIQIEKKDDGTLDFTILHYKGEPVLDPDGKQVILHKKGDPIQDHSGGLILEYDRDIVYEFDVFLIDSRYRYATYEPDRVYLKEMPSTIITWLNTDLRLFKGWALEQTQITLYPLKTFGFTTAYILDNSPKQINLEQSLEITFYLDKHRYSNFFLRETIASLAKKRIAEAFKSSRIARNEIISNITIDAGEDIIAVDIHGLGGSLDLAAFTLADPGERCNIKKRLERNPDGTLRMVDDLRFVYIRHEG